MWSELLNDKLYSDASALAKKVTQWQLYNEKVVFTNGCFDILHLGHINYLSKAADLGDRLIIGVNTDESVGKLKGPSRPVIDQHTRAMKLAAMTFVDAVILFGEETPLALITAIKPNVLAKGGDYTVETIIGAQEVIENGGSVQVIPFLEGNSTTAIINKIVG